jgi:hypothetical protein
MTYSKNMSHDRLWKCRGEKKERDKQRKAGEGQEIAIYFNFWDKLTAGGLKICLNGPKYMGNV